MVPQIDEQQAAMVALGMDPAGKPGGLADIGGPEGGAIMGAVGVNLFHGGERNLAPFPVKRGGD